MTNLPRIVREAFAYISDYKGDLNGIQKLQPKEWQRRYGRSTLPYFDDFLRSAESSGENLFVPKSAEIQNQQEQT